MNSISLAISKSNVKPWLVCLSASLFFLYEFIQVNMFNSIDPEIVKEFHLSATQLGLWSACYFYATVGFLLPAGQILDRFSAKVVILTTLIICVIGITGFSLSTSLMVAAIFRFLEGIGSAFCFLGSFRIASKWFPPERMAFVTGVIVTIGMMGGVIAQTPLTLLVEKIGWRNSLLLDAVLGLFIVFLILINVEDNPDGLNGRYKLSQANSYWRTLRLVYLVPHNWFCGLYTCLLNLPLALLGALWGSLYLGQVHHFSRIQSANIITMIFIGTIVGSPIAGFISDRIEKRKLPMFIGALLSMIVSLLIIYAPSVSYNSSIILFFLMGLFTSTQILGYPTAAEQNIPSLMGMSSSVVSFTTMSGYIIFQPLFGWIMDMKGKPIVANEGLSYAASNYQAALLIIPVSMAVAMTLTMMMKNKSAQ